MSATQFAMGCLGLDPTSPDLWAPPVPTRPRTPRYAPGDRCWLCGGLTYGVGWWRHALPDTFTNHNLAAVTSSETVCQACMFCASKETWEAYVAAHPDRGLKCGHAMSWRFYSHVFAAGLHDCPTRERWRAWLLEPPVPPFLFVVATSGQKHLLFRGRVAYDRARFPVQVEEAVVWVERDVLAAVLADVEALYALGFAKDAIVSGRYHHGQLMKVGLAAWQPLDRAMQAWRRRVPDLVQLAAHVAQRQQEGA